MVFGPFYFKQKAREALRGNWQTALVVVFFSGVFLTVANILQSLWLPDPLVYASYGLYNEFAVAILRVTDGMWAALLITNVLALVLTPALSIGVNRYFLARMEGQELGVREGLFGRVRIWRRALWLYVLMGVRIFLWSLLFLIPGILAAIRYSMAPYYLAQDPNMKASEAIEKSKSVMKNMKMAYFMLMISFIGWSLLASVAQMLLLEVNTVIALVAAQFMQLAISTYMNGACAAFFLTVGSEDGLGTAKREMRSRMREMGMDESAIDAAGLGEEPEEAKNDSDDGGEEK